MPKKEELAAVLLDDAIVIEDAAELTPKELENERKAALEERKRQAWLSHSPQQLANRIPVSIFAMGDMTPQQP